MKLLLPLSIFLVTAVPAIAQKPQPIEIRTSHVISAPGTKGWRKSKVDPIAFAKKVDAAMKALKATRQQVVVVYQGQRGSGQALNEAKIIDRTHYAIQYFNIDTPEPYNGEVRADGSRFSMQGAGVWSKPVPLSMLPRDNATIVNAVRGWPLGHPKMMYTGILFKANIFTTLVKGYMQGQDGYVASVEERTTIVQTVTVRNLRIVAKMNAAGAKKFGPSTIELMFDATRHLPVTIRVHMHPKKDKKPTKMLWQSIWRFNQVFKPEDFRLPSG